MVAGPVFWRNISHDDPYKAVIRAYNDWLAEEYCAVAPDLLIGMGVMPITNAEDAIAEMGRTAGARASSSALAERPGLPDPGRRPLGCRDDLDMPVTVHVLLTAPARAPISRPSNTREDPSSCRLRRRFSNSMQFRPAAVGQHRAPGRCSSAIRNSRSLCRDAAGWVPFWSAHGSRTSAMSAGPRRSASSH
jgi:hypothetical protein